MLTHEHYDHTDEAEVFPDAQIICHVTCADIFSLDTYSLTPAEVDITFETFLSIELDNKVVEDLLNVAPQIFGCRIALEEFEILCA
ncbi:hypothetical protein KFU94_43535 [Chloroflexi bacterium TSY]|nr:hypothetical protein [Chloroflexi bacterium TSY]